MLIGRLLLPQSLSRLMLEWKKQRNELVLYQPAASLESLMKLFGFVQIKEDKIVVPRAGTFFCTCGTFPTEMIDSLSHSYHRLETVKD